MKKRYSVTGSVIIDDIEEVKVYAVTWASSADCAIKDMLSLTLAHNNGNSGKWVGIPKVEELK